jgi:hypothetical protein
VCPRGDCRFLALPVGLAFDDEFVGGRLQPVHPGLGLELNQSAHHCRPMMMCWWRSGWVWVRLGLTSSSKR